MSSIQRSVRPITSLQQFALMAMSSQRLSLCVRPSASISHLLPLSNLRAAGLSQDAASLGPVTDDRLQAGLYLVATPLGNLEDITLRALRVFRGADVVLCEDTRRTLQLLTHFGIHTAVESCHKYNERAKAGKVWATRASWCHCMYWKLSSTLFPVEWCPCTAKVKRPDPSPPHFEKQVLERLKQGAVIALASDAGTPGINDPGNDLVIAAAAEGMAVIPVPGPSAVIAALTASALPLKDFMFCGFAEAKSSARKKQFQKVKGAFCSACFGSRFMKDESSTLASQSLSTLASQSLMLIHDHCYHLNADVDATLVFFASPHAVLHVLDDACTVLGPERRCCVARELTKVHEEFYRSTLAGALAEFTARGTRGEFTLVIEGNTSVAAEVTDETILAALHHAVEQGNSPSQAAKVVAMELSIQRKRAYSLSLELEDTVPSET